MLPMWIIAIVTVSITYFSMSLGLVSIPTEVFSLWYCPEFLQGFFVSGISGVLLTAINFTVAAIIWYPFFKMYDNKLLEEEANGIEDED